jgi:beta-lactamase class A
MSLNRCITAGLASLLAASPLRAQSLDTLRHQLEARIAQSGATVGLYFRDLVRPESLAIGADLRFHAASTMKVPVLIQAFRDIDARRLSTRERMIVRNEFRSLADSSTYSLSATDDSDSSLYTQVGKPVEVSRLLELMITRSSNLATNNIIERVGAARIQATLRAIGADSVTVLRGVEDGAAFRAGMNNTATARGLGVVMGSIAEASAASAQSCGEMLEILLRQRFNDAIPAGLPRRTRVAHKTGTITGAHHDAAIVYYHDRPRYILVIMTRGLPDEAVSATLMADLARLVNAHAVPESLPKPPYRPDPTSDVPRPPAE